MNETRNVLPMSPVRSVTHVAGCTLARPAGRALSLSRAGAAGEVHGATGSMSYCLRLPSFINYIPNKNNSLTLVHACTAPAHA
jgi:hypothetical protein